MAVIESEPEAAGPRDRPAEPSDGSAPPPPVADAETPEQVRSMLHLVGVVVAPTTLLTALLIYFGWAYAASFFKYFGVDISLVGLTTQDYVTGSVQVLFTPIAVTLTALMLTAWLNARLKARVFVGPDARRRLQLGSRASGLCGLVLFGFGMAGVLVVKPPAQWSLKFPLCLGTGAVLLAYALRLQSRSERLGGASAGARSTALLEVTGAFFIVALSLFWAATNYAASVGTTKAREFERRELESRPEAVLYSKEPLFLEVQGIRETSCGQPGGYRFRYEGLRLMLKSGGHYFLLPATWSRTAGTAIVVPESDAVRVQFAGPDSFRTVPTTRPDIACPSPPPTP